MLLDFLALEDGTDRVSQNVVKGLIECPKTLLRNYYSVLSDISKQCTSHMMICDAGLGVALRGPVRHFIRKLKTTLHI